MSKFIRGETRTYSAGDARTLLQKYLEYKFYHEIKTKNIVCAKFDDLITSLKRENLITDEQVFVLLNAKRKEYNVDLHGFDTQSEDAKRNSIIELQNLMAKI